MKVNPSLLAAGSKLARTLALRFAFFARYLPPTLPKLQRLWSILLASRLRLAPCTALLAVLQFWRPRGLLARRGAVQACRRR